MEYYFKIVDGDYTDDNALDEVHNYITKFMKTRGIVGAIGVIPKYAVEMMQSVKDVYCSNEKKKLLHFIVSLPEQYVVTEWDMYEYSYSIASYFKGYQVVFGVHVDTKHIHAHFLVNTVSYVDGTVLNDYKTIRRDVDIICKNIFGPIIAWKSNDIHRIFSHIL